MSITVVKRGASPLHADNSPLDARSRSLIHELYERENARLATALPPDSPLNPERRRRVAITRAEIAGQPISITATLSREADAIEGIVRHLRGSPPRRLYLTGCGDSFAVMIAARVLLEEMFEVPCEPVQALDMAYYFNRPVDRETLVIGLSSSGETPRTVEAMLMARALGARTLALTNTTGSTLTREADHVLRVHAERKGWPTQASTAALSLLFALALANGRANAKPAARIDALQGALEAVPAQIGGVISAHEAAIEKIAAAEAGKAIYLFAGGGPSFSCAFFGAAKIKECTPDHALAIPLEEFHHYQSAKPGDPLFLIAPNGLSVPRAADTAEAAQRSGATVYAVAAEDNDTFQGLGGSVIRLPPMIERLSSLVYTIPTQLFAYHLAMQKFAAAEAIHQETE